MVLPSGRVVAVDEEVANAGQFSRDTQGQVAAEEAERLNAERSSGVVEGLKAAGEGAADAASFGLYGAIRGQIDPEGARDMRVRGEQRGTERFIGEAAALVLPSAGVRGLGLTAPGLARGANRALGGGFAGQAVEGGLLGFGGYVASTNISGDPLTIEAAVESATIGALLDVGLHAAANRVEGMVWAGKSRDAKNLVLAEDLKVAKKGVAAFHDTPPSWNEFVDLHEARKASVNKYNTEVAREAKRYDDFWQSNSKLTAAIDSAQEAVDAVRRDVYAKQGGAFAREQLERVKYNLDTSGQAKTVEYTYEQGKQKFDFDGDPDKRTVIGGPGGESVPAQGAPRLRQQQYDVDGRPVISDVTTERLREFEKRISRVYKRKSGGYRLEADGKWIPDRTVAPDPRGALEELRVINADFMGWRSKGSGLLDDLPRPPRASMPEIPGAFPKSIEDFSRKHVEQVTELSNAVNDPAAAQALERVMKDLDLLDPTVQRSPADNLSALHKTLREYRGKISDLRGVAEKMASDEAAKPLLVRLLGRAARLAGGRAFDVGGKLGAFTRTLGGEAASRTMTGIENATFGSVLLESRQGIRGRLRNLVTKYGVPTAGFARKLGSPLAYLSQSFPSGEKDEETDYRKQAVNRIQELQGAALTAPDAAFMAVQGMLGHPGDIGWKMHQHIVGTLNYLVSTLPRDPGTDTMMFKSNWTPQYHEAVAMAHRLEAVNDPVTAIARAIAGDSHPAATEALWAVYPAVMNELAQELSLAAPNLKNLTYEQASAYSNLFRTPLTGLQQPVVVTAIQGMYMTSQSAPQTGRPSGGTGKAPGRPAAVQSPVAGSNVGALTRS